MAVPIPPRELSRFGEFELDRSTGELRRNGDRFYLQEKPFQILNLLLENPGQLVTREELRQRLWGDRTFVDFEQSLNKAVNRLRKVLGDSAESPRYVETLPGRGYRFALPVATSAPRSGREGNAVTKRATASDSTVASTVADPAISATLDRQNSRRQSLRVIISIGLVFAALGLLLASLLKPSPPMALDRMVQLTSDATMKRGPLLTDGTRLYFDSLTKTRWGISEISVAGGTPVTLPQSEGLLLNAISNDGAFLLATPPSEGDTPAYLIPLPAGTTRRLGNVLASDLTWSRDQQQIAYANGNDLYAGKADGSESRKLASLEAPPWSIRWSLDGKRLRFTAKDNGLLSIWEVGSNGTNLHPLFHWKPAQLCCGDWTADGKYFIFQSDRGGASNLWAIRESTGPLHVAAQDPFQLTNGPMQITYPAASKDGKKIFAIGKALRVDIMRFDRVSGRFTEYLPGVSAVHIAISRDRQWVAYITYPDRILWRSQADGTEPIRLSPPGMLAYWPAWSPDGSRIAFAGQTAGTPSHIYSVSVDGSHIQQLTSGTLDESTPSWSPDGSQLTYGRRPYFSDNLDGIHLLNLRTSQSAPLPGSTKTMCLPSWSPNGDYIAAQSEPEGNLLLFDVKKKTWTELTAIRVGHHNWSTNSEYVYFDSPSGQASAFYRVRVSDHKLERIVDLSDIHRPAVGSPTSWTGLGPDDSPIVLRDISSHQVYAFDWVPR
jgi:Tol biopolymer transport system component/DNA-binding winged helix-turn-helix (wHTH) protein